MSPAPVFVRIPGSHHPGIRLRLIPGFRDPGSVLILGQVTQYGNPYLICITIRCLWFILKIPKAWIYHLMIPFLYVIKLSKTFHVHPHMIKQNNNQGIFVSFISKCIHCKTIDCITWCSRCDLKILNNTHLCLPFRKYRKEMIKKDILIWKNVVSFFSFMAYLAIKL